MKTMKYAAAWLCGILLLAGCQKEEFNDNQGTGKGVSLQCIPARIGVLGAGTRAAGDKGDQMTSDEKRITSLDVFLFDTDGNYLDPYAGTEFQGYKHFDGNQNWVLSKEMFADADKAGTATVYVLANLEKGTLGTVGSDGRPQLRKPDGSYAKIEKKTDLDNYVYQPEQLPADGGIPEDGLPMYAIVENQNLNHTGTATLIQIPLESLMARVDVSMKLVVPNSEYISGSFPNYVSREFNLKNVPASTRILPPDTDEQTGGNIVETEQDVVETINIEWKNAPITHQQGSISKRFYMFEHHRQYKEQPVYPDDIEEGHQQRYKPRFAKKDATYVEICGNYTNHNAYEYHVDYQLYLGRNAVDDYVVLRNKQYRNNVTIRGITATSNPANEETVVLDTRVTLEETDPYYISMLRERNHDAHFNVTPMDIYVQRGYVTVELEGGRTNNWLRMEYVGEEANRGDKKRPQFHEELMKDLDENTTNRGNLYGVGPYRIDAGAPNKAERIYLYLDENLETTDGKNGKDREANLIIKHYERGQVVDERKLLIRQKGLWYLTARGEYGGAQDFELWAEVYEEYSANYDPKDDYGVTYNGLAWDDGTSQEISEAGNFENGHLNTAAIVNKLHDDFASRNLNETPRSAAEYCYNKNIRNTDGTVTDNNNKWFLPGITQMEAIVKMYAPIEQNFQDYFYWSSTVDYNKDNSYARSTKAQWDERNSKWVHVESEYKNGVNLPGRKKRTEALRIRAVRIDLNPVSGPIGSTTP